MCCFGRDGTSSYAQLRLLLWKNWTLKKRRWGATCCELLFPVCAVFILIAIRAIVKIEDVDVLIPVGDKASAARDLPLMVVSMVCGMMGSTDRFPWQSIGLAAGPNLPGDDLTKLAQDMRKLFWDLGMAANMSVPCCAVPTGNGDGSYMPACYQCKHQVSEYLNSSTIIRIFPTSDAMDDYIQNDDYGWNANVQTLIFGAVIDRSPTNKNQWSYSIRGNNTDMPWTGTSINTLVGSYSKSDFFQYYRNHILSFQLILDTFILTRNLATEVRTDEADQPLRRLMERLQEIYAPKSIDDAISETEDLVGEVVDDTISFISDPSPSTPPQSGIFDVSYVPFPFPAHRQDNFKAYIGQVFGLFLVIAFMWPFSRMVRNMVEEKEKKLAEGMKMMGLRNSVFWMSWVVTYLISFTIVCILVIAVSKLSLFKYSDTVLLFMFFFSFCLSLISLACLVTTFFGRAKTAGTLSPFLLLAGYLPYFAVSDADKAEGLKNLACLLSPVAFSLGSTQIISYESVFIGSQFNNSGSVVDNFRLSTAISLMFFDAFLYAVIAWYLDKIWPREYGTALKWYFLFTPSYWKDCCSCRRVRKKKSHRKNDSSLLDSSMSSAAQTPRRTMKGINVTTAESRPPIHSAVSPNANYGTSDLNSSLLASQSYHDDDFNYESDDGEEVEPDFGPDYEAVPEALRSKVGVKIRGLKKQFKRDGNEVIAVKGLDLNLYLGQCFVLLGHNGAGKTTTISMLTGMIPSTEGSAHIYGRDTNTEMNEIRTFMGLCPQHDVLYDDLTVYEHLEFFGKLKGILRRDLHEAVMAAIEEVQLKPKLMVLASALSGGQRRRLSLAIALMGDSKVVFLDEPTSGVDPFSRRAIWDLLTKKKEGRILVLTTHFMDEADNLADRIGIMHHGEMKCCGTPLFLKSKYGAGYLLTMTLQDKSRGANVDNITKLITRDVPEAALTSSVGTELSYSLPLTAAAVFPSLLADMDQQMQSLGITNYGLSVTTMEEVFIKVAEEVRPGDRSEDEKGKGKDEEKDEKMIGEDGNPKPSISHQEAMSIDLSSHQSSWFTHFRAILSKRWNIQKRDKKALCCQFLVPLILLVLGMGLLRIPPNFDFPKAQLVTGDNGPYNLPNRIPYNPGLPKVMKDAIYLSEGQMELFSSGGDGTHSYDLYNFSAEILANRTQYEESRYGALFATPFDELEPNANETFNLWQFTVMANASAVHGLPAWTLLGHQALLRVFTNDSDASITGNIHPFSWTPRQKQAIQSLNGIFASIVISLAFTFIPASYAVFIVLERENKSKHLQMISGVSMTSYWCANYVWDFISYIIPASVSCAVIYIYHNPELVNNFDVLLMTFLCYGLSIIPFTYLFSFLFSSHSTAQNVMIMIYILGGIIATNTVVALFLVPSTKEISKKYLRHVFRLLPSFCLGDAIFYISVLPFLEDKPTKWDMIVSGFDIVYMLCSSVVYFALTLAIDYLQSIPSFVGLFKKDPEMKLKEGAVEEEEDEDIKAERERLQNSALTEGESDCYTNLTESIEQHGTDATISEIDHENPRNDLIRIEGLRKVYPPAKNPKTAVKDVYFGVPAGQCFGFLGVNGAGKTTTIKIMTGDVTPSKGRAYIGGYDIANYPAHVRRLLGYCPQHDALFDLLTARETLNFYGKIRGIPEDRMKKMVSFLIDRLSLKEYADRPSGTYSGGNKRKLSVAIALIGNPPVVFLDEPSTGMDPVSRRFMWDFISETMSNRAVVLTTHSMEECEALCARIGILVDGGLKCIGSSQHLKSRFGRGFQIDVSTAANDTTRARDFILEHFPDAEKLEDYGGKMKYKILHTRHSRVVGAPDDSSSSSASPLASPTEQKKLHDIFALIEQNKDAVGISEYSVGQTTLEQIFIRFAKRGAVEEFGGEVKSEEEEEAEKEAAAAVRVGASPPPHNRRADSYDAPDMNIITPSSYGYLPASSTIDQASPGINQ